MAGTSIRSIKRRIRSVKSIEHITNAMKLVSAAKLRRAKNLFERVQEHLGYVTDSINELCANVEEIPSHYLPDGREIGRTCYIVVASNRGLAGSYNTNIMKAAEREMQRRAASEALKLPEKGEADGKGKPEGKADGKGEGREDGRGKPLLVCIGGRARNYFSKRGYDVIAEYLSPPENVSFLEASELSKPIIELYDKGEVDEVVLVYTTFVSTMEQRAVAERLLPFEPNTKNKKTKKLLEYEPSAEEVFNYLVPKYAEIIIYRAIVEAATCEHAARRMAMQNATDNAREMIDNLELNFNRARQAAITKEITEIVSGADAIK